MKKLLFGTAGVPSSAEKPDTVSGVEAIARRGLGAMELEFVHGVRMKDELAQRVGETARRLGVTLTCHGPYYINLNSPEKDKLEASVTRILDTARAAHKAGAVSITFHAAFYQKGEPRLVHERVREHLARIIDQLESEGIDDVEIRPELTGKPSQYGNLEELIQLSLELPRVMPCIDFSHLHARTAGGFNRREEFEAVLDKLKTSLGKDALARLHIHVSGIEYTAKGERKHLQLDDSDFNYKDLLKALKSAGAAGVVICESPDPEPDALLLQRTYNRLRTPRKK